MIKLAIIDVETTGLNHWTHCPWSLTARFYPNPVTLTLKFKPLEGAQIDAEALKVGGVTTEELATFEAPLIAYQKFVSVLSSRIDKYNKSDKLHFVGYNARFDMDFLRSWFSRQGDKFFGSWFWFPPIDVMALAAVELMDHRAALADFKLATVAHYFGMEVDKEKLHIAEYDVELTDQLFRWLKPNVLSPEPAPAQPAA